MYVCKISFLSASGHHTGKQKRFSVVVGTVTPVPVPHPQGRVPHLISEDLLPEKRTPTKQLQQQDDNVQDHVSYKYKDEI